MKLLKIVARKAILVIFITLFFFVGGAFGQGKDFPTMPINMYLGYPPGGGIGNCALFLVEAMKKYLPQPVVLNYKTGAVQAVAADFVAKSKPDGHTILYSVDQDLIVKTILDGPTLKFTMDSFVHLGSFPITDFAFVVNSDSPWKTMEEFIEYGRKSPPGTLKIGASGLANACHLMADLFIKKTGIHATYIPFTGGAPADMAVLGGHINAAIGSIGRYVEHFKPGGGLRPLFFYSKERYRQYPDVPTLVEKGYDVVMPNNYGLHAPNGISIAVKNILVQAFEKAAKEPDIVSAINKYQFLTLYNSPEEHSKNLQEDKIFYRKILTEGGFVKK